MNEDALGRRSTWDDEDAQLPWQATARADALMRDGCVSVGWRHLGWLCQSEAADQLRDLPASPQRPDLPHLISTQPGRPAGVPAPGRPLMHQLPLTPGSAAKTPASAFALPLEQLVTRA